MRSITPVSTVFLMLAAPALAHAGGFGATRFGGEDGHAATSDPTAAYFNPAGLAYTEGTQAYIEGFFAQRRVTYKRDPAAIDNRGTGTPDAAVDRNSGEGTLSNPLVSPFIGFVVKGLVPGLGVGLSVSVPFGGQASWDKDTRFANDATYPGAVDGPARWATIEGTQRSLFYTLAAGWHTRDGKFGVGAGLNVVQSQISLVRARNVDGTDDLVRPNGSIAEGRSLLEVDGIDLSATLGLMWKPTPSSRVGLSYHSQPSFGESTLSGTLTNQFGDSPPAASDVELRQELPDILRLAGLWRAADKIVLHAALDMQRWSQFKNQCIVTPGAPASACAPDADGMVVESSPLVVNIPRAWQDVYGIRIGGAYEVSDALTVNGGILYDTNAVPDATLDPALIDADKVVPQVGVRFRTGKVTLNGTIGHVFYMDRTTAARTVDPSGKNRNPDMAGDYSTGILYALLGVGVAM